MKTSKIKKLVPKKLAQQLAAAHARDTDALHTALRAHGTETIAKMRGKGYDLVACLETGEGVFARDDNVVGLHIQLPQVLYQRLGDECTRRGVTKRSVVVEALEGYFKSDDRKANEQSITTNDDSQTTG